MLVDLRNHIVSKAGTWTDATLLANEQPQFTLADTYTPSKLMMRWPNDSVTLAGPLRVRISFQSENVTYPVSFHQTGSKWAEPQAHAQPAGSSGSGHEYLTPNVYVEEAKANLVPGALGVHASTVYSYVLDIPAAQAWPFRFREDELTRKLGTNFGYRVIVEPAFETAVSVSAHGTDLPCDFAAVAEPDVGRFFPAACEPCPPGSAIGLPPLSPALGIPAAAGGCVRPRWFNGQFITREDLETEQRYFRLKGRLQNRAMGDGVVWGFAVGKAGNSICVMPGYGVDCCGNDLTLSSVYRVDISTLLRDPAALAGYSAPAFEPADTDPANAASPSGALVTAARQPAGRYGVALDRGCFEPARFDARRGVRMHLLLEYVECPSDPRPIHSDPCAGTASRCEMSRIRETVRLRLVPPRDFPITGPLKTFLDRVASLRTAHPLTEAVQPLPAQASAPFRFKLTLFTAEGEHHTTFPIDDVPRDFSAPQPITRVRVDIVDNPMWVFTDGTLRATTGQNQPVLPTPQPLPTPFGVDPPHVHIPGAVGTQLRVQLDQWMAQSYLAAGGEVLSGTALLDITQVSTTLVRLQGAAENANISRGTLELPEVCEGEACLPRGAKPVLPHLPWLHADPVDPSVAGDPKALVLAALGGWLTKTLAAHRTGTNEEFSAKRSLVTGLYEAAWLLFYGQQQGTTPAETSDAICHLFRDWCEAFLYKGPKCAGDPHGVVIGCTVVTGGTIGDIDPYGGRRWVLHGPLIGHWTSQLGIAPLDIIASRFMSQLCCVASLPGIGALPAFPVVVQKLSSGFLTFGTPDEVKQQLQDEYGVTVTHHDTVGFFELVQRFSQAQQSMNDAGNNATRYSLGSPMQGRVLSIVIRQPKH